MFILNLRLYRWRFMQCLDGRRLGHFSNVTLNFLLAKKINGFDIQLTVLCAVNLDFV